jgi:hypothetical protein
MPTTPRVTNREEMEAVLEGRGPLGGERLVEHNIFLTDAFNKGVNGASPLFDAPGPSDQIDGFDNDDSYRRSRHLLLRRASSTPAAETNLRENSLARQLQEKEDQPATIRLIRRRRPEDFQEKDATEPQLPWINLIPPNTKFFLEQVQENREEKVQVIDTFGEWIAFFFGRKPEVYSYSGTLLNAANHNWKNEFQENYDHFLRGSQAAKNRATIVLQYDDVVVEGYMLNCSISMNSQADKAVPFSFNLLVISRSPLDPRGIIGLRALRSGITDAEAELFNSMQESLDLTKAGRIDEIETFLLLREYFSGRYVPGAGTSLHHPETNNFGTTTSTQPGQVGGIADNKAQPATFNDKTTNAIKSADSSQNNLTTFFFGK